MPVGDADPVRAFLVAEAVEDLVRLTEVEARGLEVGVRPVSGRRRDDRVGGLAVAEEDDVDDLLAVDGVVEGFLHLEVQQLPVRLLLRVGVDDEVGLVEAGDVGDVEAGALE